MMNQRETGTRMTISVIVVALMMIQITGMLVLFMEDSGHDNYGYKNDDYTDNHLIIHDLVCFMFSANDVVIMVVCWGGGCLEAGVVALLYRIVIRFVAAVDFVVAIILLCKFGELFLGGMYRGLRDG